MKLKSILCLSAMLGALVPISAYSQEQSITFTTSKSVGSAISISVNRIIEGFSVDWGDGTPVAYEPTSGNLRTIEGTVKGSELKVTSSGNIKTFICEGAGITDIDLKNADQLQSVYLANNELAAISFSGLSQMLDIDISGNQISRLSIPESTLKLLQNLNIANNGMERYNNYKRFRYTRASLEHANISGNKFETLATASNTNLKTLFASDNLFTTADFSSNPELNVLVCDGNQLTELNFNEQTGAPNLLQISCDNNSISSLVLNKSSRLMDLSCVNNGMKEIKLPANKLSMMKCGGNALTYSSLPLKTRQPEEQYFSYKPQSDINLKDALQVNEETGGYYIPQCPSYSDRNTSTYQLSLASYRYDATGSATVTIDWYYIDESGAPVKMVRATAGKPENDFTHSTGVYTFLKPFKEIYAELTHSAYPDFVISTQHFAVGKDNATSISAVQGAEPVHHEVFDLQGRKVAQPQKGIYIVDGKKIYF